MGRLTIVGEAIYNQDGIGKMREAAITLTSQIAGG